MNKSLLVEFLLKYTLLEVILFNIYRNKNQSINNITLVYLLEVPPWIEVPLGKIADFKRVKMVNTS